MIDYYGNRHNETFIYKRVAWSNWQEHESYGFITSGSLEMSTESNLVVTGSFSFEGFDVPDTEDLLRIYYSFTDDTGERSVIVLATLFISYGGLEYIDTTKGLKASGSLNGYSVLSVLEDKKCGAPFTVSRNSNAIYKAVTLIKELGLNVEYTPGTKVLSADHTFKAGTSHLEIVRWLCQEAGYSMPYPDPMGTVMLKPYDQTERRTDTFVFTNDEDSIMYPEIEAENSWQETPNVVRLLYNTDQACIAAEARNVSGSRASLAARGGREQTHFEEIGELDDSADKRQQLADRAEKKLRELSCDVEYVTMKHAFIPIDPYQPVTIIYSDLEWTGNAENIQIDLSPATVTQTKIKRTLYDQIEVTKQSEVLRAERGD